MMGREAITMSAMDCGIVSGKVMDDGDKVHYQNAVVNSPIGYYLAISSVLRSSQGRDVSDYFTHFTSHAGCRPSSEVADILTCVLYGSNVDKHLRLFDPIFKTYERLLGIMAQATGEIFPDLIHDYQFKPEQCDDIIVFARDFKLIDKREWQRLDLMLSSSNSEAQLIAEDLCRELLGDFMNFSHLMMSKIYIRLAEEMGLVKA